MVDGSGTFAIIDMKEWLSSLGFRVIIDFPFTEPETWGDDLVKDSNGLLLYSYLDFAEDVIDFMLGDGYYSNSATYNMILSNSLKKIRLKSPLNQHNYEDTDGDGIRDWGEIDKDNITVNSGDNAVLMTYYDYLNKFCYEYYRKWREQYRFLYDEIFMMKPEGQ